MEASELEGTLSTRADGWPLKKHSSALAAGPRHIHLLTRCACRAEFSSSLTAFGEGDEDEDDSESEDEDEMMASLSHAELCEMLSGTRAQLAQAAELGQALMVELQQMELLKQDNAQLQEQKEEWEASQEEHEWRIEELEECDPHPTLRAASCHVHTRTLLLRATVLQQGTGTAPGDCGRPAYRAAGNGKAVRKARRGTSKDSRASATSHWSRGYHCRGQSHWECWGPP